MCREGNEIRSHLLDIKRDFARRLGRIGMKQYFPLPCRTPDRGERLHHANLIVGGHDGHEHRLRPERVDQLIDIDQAIRPDRMPGDAKPLALQLSTRVKDSPMFGRKRHDMTATRSGCAGRAKNRQIVRFCCAAGEDDVFCARADECRRLLTRPLDRLGRAPAERMSPARRVPEMLGKKWQHRLHDSPIHRSRGMRIHKDGELAHIRRGNSEYRT